jgi:adenosylcobinamide-phosphate synthase
MTLISLIAAFLIEQVQPLDVGKWMRAPLGRVAEYFETRFNDGQARHGMVAWILAVAPLVVVVAVLYHVLDRIHPLFALVLNVGVLYLTMGFRHVSHYFTGVHEALRKGELDRARSLIAEWRGHSAERLSSSEVAKLAIEEALVAAHRHVFGVAFWFVILPGPSGAILYRMAEFFAERWGRRSAAELGAFGQFAQSAFVVLDWLPLRFTALAFAVVGDFEDAVYCWRTQAARWSDPASGILLASGAGALGVRLGMPVYESGEITERPELGLGDDADADFMQSTVGLVWRTLVLSLMLLTLLGIASWVGS